MNDLFTDADIIHTYTRAQALEDGFIADLNQWIPVNESGYKYPIACTNTVFALIEKAVKNPHHFNDYKGVIWDIMYMSRAYVVKRWETGVLFQVKIKGAARQQIFTFKMECTGGDDGEPVLTISLPNED